jgi:phosphatidyl-myo-inositol dimannoside synthase
MPHTPKPAFALLVSNDFPPQVGGIQGFCDHVLRRLPAAAAFVAAHPRASEHDATAPYRVIRGVHRYLLPTASTARGLRAAVAATGAEVLMFATPWPLVGLGHRLGLPTVAVVHGAELIMASRIPGVSGVVRRWLRRADLLLSVSEHTAEHLRWLVGDSGPPIRLLRNGVTLTDFDPSADGRHIREQHGLGDAPTVLCVGRLVKRKGQDVLIEAWPEVLRHVPDARLVIVGTGPIREDLEQAARDLPPGAVVFAGRVPEVDLPAYFAATDVFAHPNRARWFGFETEGFGVVFLEAQAAGRPVIAGASGGAPEALIDGETGLLVDGRDPAAVAAAVVDLLSDRDRARTMGAAGRRFVEEEHDWDHIVAGLADELTALAAGSPPSSMF